jgi:outer membrane immunogenic protein
MRNQFHAPLSLLLTLLSAIAVAFALPSISLAQTAPMEEEPRAELALGYSYVHSNLPPGGCGCFSLNGGNATIAWPIRSSGFALAGDITIAHASSSSGTGDGITLSTFTAGGRYLPHVGHSAWQPFAQVLVGFAHANGALVSGSNPGSANADASFAANIGGGLDLRTNPGFSIRLVEADYLLTTFDNGTNNHQNNIRIGAGVVVRFR